MSAEKFEGSTLTGKVVVVTGGSQGIGRSIAELFSAHRATVVLVDVQEDRARELMRGLPGESVFIRTDLSSAEGIDSLIAQLAQKFPCVDVLINNARPRLARSDSAELASTLLDGWDTGLAVLLTAPARLAAGCLPLLRKSSSPSVLNISSTNARLIAPQPMVYHVAKAALDQMTRYLAYELGKVGVRVNGIAPGLVNLTDRGTPLSSNPIHRQVTELCVPLKRPATGREIADVALFLSGPGAAYINGEVLMVDGGITLGDQFHVAKAAILEERGE